MGASGSSKAVDEIDSPYLTVSIPSLKSPSLTCNCLLDTGCLAGNFVSEDLATTFEIQEVASVSDAPNLMEVRSPLIDTKPVEILRELKVRIDLCI